jgi:hypothetical protein
MSEAICGTTRRNEAGYPSDRNCGAFVVFPHPCGPPRGQTGNEGQSNADLTLGKPGQAYLAAQTPALFRPCIPAALQRWLICLNGSPPTWKHRAMKR